MRFNKPDYYKPDFVLLLESTGNYHQKSQASNEIPSSNEGSNFEIAPTFILTYKNWALRCGVQFGIFSSGDIEKTETNAKVTIEVHI